MIMQLLTSVKKLVELSEDDQRIITAAFHTRQLRKKETLLLQGSVCMVAAFIAKGLVRIYHADSQDNQCVLRFAQENDWALDLGSFVSHQASVLSIEALETTRILYIDHAGIQALFQQVPAFECYVRLVQQQTIVQLQQRLMSVMRQTANQRYLQFVQMHPGLEQRVPQKQVAAFLGISPEFLSKLRGQLTRGAEAQPRSYLAQAA
jgi:CRP-like cAMP-binding protein